MNETKIKVEGLSLFYGDQKALKEITVDLKKNTVTGIIGPSGCGKSTFLRCLNRMNDLIQGARIEGAVLVDGKKYIRPRCRCGCNKEKDRDGVPKVQSVPEIYL